MTTLANRHTRLIEVNDDLGKEKARFKALVGEVNMADHEIAKLKRKVRAVEHRIEKLKKQQTDFQRDRSRHVEMEQEKVRLAEEVRKKREGEG